MLLSIALLAGERQQIVCRTSADRLSDVSRSFVGRQQMTLRCLATASTACKWSSFELTVADISV
jgi:hypothetical protein